MSKRRKPPRRSPIPRPPEVPHLIGWSARRLMAETGMDAVTTMRALRKGVADGELVRLESGGRVMWARLGAPIEEVEP